MSTTDNKPLSQDPGMDNERVARPAQTSARRDGQVIYPGFPKNQLVEVVVIDAKRYFDDQTFDGQPRNINPSTPREVVGVLLAIPREGVKQELWVKRLDLNYLDRFITSAQALNLNEPFDGVSDHGFAYVNELTPEPRRRYLIRPNDEIVTKRLARYAYCCGLPQLSDLTELHGCKLMCKLVDEGNNLPARLDLYPMPNSSVPNELDV